MRGRGSLVPLCRTQEGAPAGAISLMREDGRVWRGPTREPFHLHLPLPASLRQFRFPRRSLWKQADAATRLQQRVGGCEQSRKLREGARRDERGGRERCEFGPDWLYPHRSSRDAASFSQERRLALVRFDQIELARRLPERSPIPGKPAPDPRSIARDRPRPEAGQSVAGSRRCAFAIISSSAARAIRLMRAVPPQQEAAKTGKRCCVARVVSRETLTGRPAA